MTALDVQHDDFGLLGVPPRQAPLLAFPFLAAPFLTSLWLARHFQSITRGSTWAERFPVFYFERHDINPAAANGAVYQRWSIGVFVIFPLVCSLFLFGRFLEAEVFIESGPAIISSRMDHFVPHIPADKTIFFDNYRYGAPDGLSYLPVVIPWLYLGILVWVLTSWVRTLRGIFFPPTPKS
jgi:hypothetical protein